MMWTVIIKEAQDKIGVVHFDGPHDFREAHTRLSKLGYQPVALVKGTHPVATEGGEQSAPKMLGSI